MGNRKSLHLFGAPGGMGPQGLKAEEPENTGLTCGGLASILQATRSHRWLSRKVSQWQLKTGWNGR